MNKLKRTSLRLLSLLLVLLMCVTMIPATAFAAQKEADEAVGENGPASSSAYVALSDGFAWKYPYRVKTGAATVLDGAGSYDPDTNTLTLNNFRGAAIETNKMGEDFKIKLIGRNVVANGVNIWGDGWGASAYITGDGTLTAFGITIMAEGSPAVFEVGPEARVTTEGGGIHVYDSKSENPLRFSGKERSGGKAGRIRSTIPPVHPSWDLNSTSYGEGVYYNPTRPYAAYSQYAETEYFAVQRGQGTATRNKDKKTMKYVSFTLREVRYENEMYVWYSTITQLYVWEDTDLYQRYRNNLEDLTLEALDPNYQPVYEESFSETEWAVVNNLGEALGNVDIVPQSADVMMFPELDSAELEDGLMGKYYTAKLHATPANGGRITDFKITGSASEWLNIDSQGNLGGKPRTAGMYSLWATATETVDGVSIETLPVRFRLFVKEPTNMFTFAASVTDSAAHTLSFEKKDGSFTKTMDIGNNIIGEGRAFSLDGFPAGDYTVTLTGTMNGADVSYGNPTAEFTLVEGQHNNISFNPGVSTVTPHAGSVSLKINNFSLLKGYYPILHITLTDGNVIDRNVYEEYTFFPDLLGDSTAESFELLVSDAAGRKIKATDGEIAADDNSLTANASVSGITEYTVVGVPSGFGRLFITINHDRSFSFMQPENSWETPKYKLGTLSEDDELTASFSYYGVTEEARKTYELYDEPIKVTLSGTEIKVDVPELDKSGSVSGKVTDRDGNLVRGASVVCSQQANGRTYTFSAVSDENGEYRFDDLFADKRASVGVTMEGYIDAETTVDSVKADTECDIVLTPYRYIALTVEKPLINASIYWSYTIDSHTSTHSIYYQNGTSFLLPVPYDVNGTVKVSVSSERIVKGYCEDTLEVKNGSGFLHLVPEWNGSINTEGLNEAGESVVEYDDEQHLVYVYSYARKSWIFTGYHPGKTFYVPEGRYKVQVRDINDREMILAEQQLEVKPYETSYFNAPVSSVPLNYLSASISAPSSAPTGSTYKIECYIKNIDEFNHFEFHVYDRRYSDWDSGVKGVVINGKTAGIEHNNIWKTGNTHIDWSFPMRVTFYMEQRATATTGSLIFKLRAIDNDGATYFLGSSSTAYVPNISLRVADEVRSVKTTYDDGHVSYKPDGLYFCGDTIPDKEVSLYDNGTLVAKAKSNKNGRYEGTLQLASEDINHQIRAEVTNDDNSTMSAQSICTYTPGGAVLRTIWMNNNELRPGSKLSYVTGIGGYSCRFTAAIDNPDQLDDVTYAINGKDVTGKVFFKITTIDGDRIVKAEPNSNQSRWYTENLNFDKVYPTGVKVLYRSKPADHTYSDTFTEKDGTESNLNVDLGVKRSGESTDSFDVDGWIDLTLNGYNKDNVSADEEEEKVSADELYDAMIWQLNQGEGMGTFKSLTAEQAAAKVPADKAEIRTYTDEPQWTVNDQNLHLKMVELQEKGYQTYSYVDENTGHKIYLFDGKFYYAKDATPVPSLQITKVYSGIVKTEDDPRMFKDGVMIGSTLEVQYMCDVTAGRWYRTQTATMPGGVRSAIHTSCYQIPSTWEAPFSYIDTNVFPVSSPEDEAVGAMVGGNLTKQGISFEIDFSKVSAQTYVSGAISVGGFCYGKMASATYFRGADQMKVINRQTGQAMDLLDIGLDKAINKGANTFYVGVSKESLAAAGVVYEVGEINKKHVDGGTTINDVYDAVYTQIRDNIRYYGKIKTAANYTAEHDNANVIGDFTLDKYKAERMLQKSRDMADAVVELQQAIENAQHQDEFTSRVTQQVGWLSLAASCAPGVGTEAALVLDAMCFIMSAANDTRNAKVKEAAEKFMEKYRAYVAEDEKVKDEITEDEERVEQYKKWGFDVKTRSDIVGEDLKKKKKKTPSGGGGGGTYNGEEPSEPGPSEPGPSEPEPSEPGPSEPGPSEPGPSQPGPSEPGPSEPGPSEPGPSQPSPGPTDPPEPPNPPDSDGGGSGGSSGGNTGGGDIDVELTPAHDPSGRVYEAVASNTIEGATVTLYRYVDANDPMSEWDDSDNLKQENPLKTDADGFYRWDVPEGEWYVIAEKDGYVTGSSQNDTAALVNHDGTNYLPVLPPQLDVNIPLVSYTAPVVEEISAKSDGVYIVFSKYMDESTVVPENFELLGEDGSPIMFKLEKLDSEQAPANIKYDGDAPFYTKTVRLTTELSLDKEFFVKVSEKLTSYAGTPMVSAYSDAVYADEKRTLTVPTFSVEPGEVDRNTAVTITAPEGAKVIYTTDGSAPTAENGTLAKSGTTVIVSSSMTLKAIAVKMDSKSSEIATAAYTVKVYVDTSIEIEPDVLIGDVNGDGKIDVSDATIVQMFAAEVIIPTDEQKKAADVNNDGKIDVTDATLIQMFAAEIIDHF